MDELLSNNCIDFKKLLVIKAKSLRITDQECYILLIIMTLMEVGIKSITPTRIQEFCFLPLKKIDESLISLLDKHIIARNRGLLDLNPLYHLLVTEKVEKEKKVDIISIFEDAFGRSLSQIEIGIIQGFMINGCDDQMILDALNEAVKSGVIKLNYIERILDNWKKYGVKKRFAPARKKEENDDIDDNVLNYEWWNQDD